MKGDFKIPGFVSPEAWDLIKKVLNVDVLTRYWIEQIREHEWFRIHGYKGKSGKGIIVGYHEIPIDFLIVSEVSKMTGIDE